MAHTAFAPAFAPSEARPRSPARFPSRLANPPSGDGVSAAAADLRRQQILVGETALVHGPWRRIGAARTGLLPFNA